MKSRVQNCPPVLFHNYFFIGDDVDPIDILSPSISGKDSGLTYHTSSLTPVLLSDLSQSRSGGALAGSNSNLASSFNSGLNTVGLNNGYQNQNGDRSGGGSKWGNSSRLGELQNNYKLGTKIFVCQITECPMEDLTTG